MLDRRLNRVPIGVVGELYIGGAGLARGYSGAPELTAARFVPNPFGDPGTRLYRTGDLVRLLDDGRLAFVGRTDGQVKIRGFRIEPGEIEAALRRQPSVKEAVVVVSADPSAGKRLVAYVVPFEGGDAALDDVKVALRTTLPDYMIPAAFVALDALPLTPNGKVDRGALPAVESGRSAIAPLVAPRTALETRIADVWRDVLKAPAIGVHDNFFDLGGHSLQLIQVHSRLRGIVDRPLSMMDLFRFPTVDALAGYLSGDAALPAVAAPLASPRSETGRAGAGAIAIVGMAGRFPGAKSVGEFWRNLCDGVESVQFFTDDQLRAAGVDPSLLSDPRYVRARAALDDVDLFDAPFFRYTPREAESIDPQHRLFLECAWEALEAAGHDPAAFDGRVGVYAGAGGGDYAAWLRRNPQFVSSIGGLQTLLGTGRDFLPTRVSYKLNLRGPSINVQTACSTSLVAVHLACRALIGGECDMALAGGAALGVVQTAGYIYEEDGILSPDGHCRPFDARAKGTVPGSGVGIVVLRRLEDALADGDPIVAVIKGSAINNDGSEKIGYTAPAVKGQAEVIAAAHAAAGISATSISYVETHGTGTTLGDPVELTALTQALHGAGAPARSCAIGSLKSNMGHLDAAAGVAGLIKTALALQHRQLPPTLHFTNPNPDIDLDRGPFYVSSTLADWTAGPQPRRAGVSSFGIGGTNAHVVLEEAPPRESSGRSRRWKLLPLSARTPEALNSAAANLRRHLEAHPDLDLADVAHTLQIGRRAFDYRRAIVCADRLGAIEALTLAEAERAASGAAVGADRPVVFMFPGQGSQYPGMGRDLYEEEPVFRGEVDRCAAILQPLLALDIRELLYPATGMTDRAAVDLRQTAVAQAALFVTEYALARLWMHWGVRPHAVIGHSLGEYVAAAVAGVFSLDDALALVAARGRLMQTISAGSMLAVPLSEGDLQRHLDDTMSIAAVNAPALSVASGPSDAIDALQERLTAQGAPGTRLNTSHAFHSPMMSPILEAFRHELRGVRLQAPTIPCISGLTGTWITDAQATDPDYWVRQLRQPVRFGNGIRELLGSSAGGGVFLEVGPGRTLASLTKAQGISSPVSLSSLPRPGDSETASERILSTLGRMWTEGIVVDWRRLTAGETRRKLPLPSYPFERRRYRVEPSGPAAPTKTSDDRRRAPFDQWFYAPSWSQSVARHPRPDADARWLVFTDDSGVGDGLIGALAAAGRRIVAVQPGARFTVVADDRYSIDPGSQADYCTLIDALRARGHVPDRVVHLWTVSGEPAAIDEAARIARAFYSPVFLARALGRFLGERRKPIEIAVVTSGAHDVLGDESLDPVGAMAVGACKVIPLEYPNLTCRAIDVDPPRGAAAAARVAGDILKEIDGGAPDVTVAYRNHRRWTQAVARLGADAFAAEPRLRKGGVYLVTGAFGASAWRSRSGSRASGRRRSCCWGARRFHRVRSGQAPTPSSSRCCGNSARSRRWAATYSSCRRT
nr:phosphopantetheine-binding domain-containing pro [uncultured bacterium]